MNDLEVFLITNRNLVESDEEYFNKISEAIKAGVSKIIFREKYLPHSKQKFYYREIMKLTRGYNCSVIINSNIKLYKEEEAEYLHLPFKDFLKYKSNKNEKIGVSVHSIDEAIKASELQAHYILVSNIYKTKCKPGMKRKGIDFLKEVKNNVQCKIVALGGINSKNIREVYSTGGISSIAVMSLLMESIDAKRTLDSLSNNL